MQDKGQFFRKKIGKTFVKTAENVATTLLKTISRLTFFHYIN